MTGPRSARKRPIGSLTFPAACPRSIASVLARWNRPRIGLDGLFAGRGLWLPSSGTPGLIAAAFP